MSITDSQIAFDSYRRTSRVFILGAGFSVAAGIPLTARLLQEAMSKFAIECPGIFSRVDGYAREIVFSHNGRLDYSQLGFSDLCTHLEFIELKEFGGGERWSDAGSREKLALRFYLAKRIVEATPSGNSIPDIYLQFADQLNDRDIVISFNWDGLLELALQKIGKPYTYNFDRFGVNLCKLHGSVNWRLGEPNDLGYPVNSLGWEPLGFAQGLIDQEIWQTPQLLSFLAWDGFKPLREVQPFLVLPGYGKAFDVRSIATLWYRPEFAFSTTRDIYVIGLSLAPDDHFIRSFFLNCLPVNSEDYHLFIINPDPAVHDNYAFALSSHYTDLFETPFSMEHVSLMRERLEVD